MYKKMLYIFGLTSVLVFLSVFIIVVTVDPFQQYRKASFYQPIYNNANYLIPGIAKNYDYNSFVLGSSMTENFILSEVAKLDGFKFPIKLSLSGAKARNLKILSDVAFENSHIDSILIGLDMFSLTGGINDTANGEASIPHYLYDDNIFNDYKYIFNIDMLFECLRPFIYKYVKGSNSDVFNYDIMFSNNVISDRYPSSIAINHYKSYLKKLENMKDKNLYNYKFKQLKNNFDTNILPMMQKHQQTRFILFYPPYSILTYKFVDKKGWLTDFTSIKEYIYYITDNLPNVEIYDFQVEKEITHNLNNYRDYSHYHYKINTWMLEKIRDKKYKVNKINVETNTKVLQAQVKEYIVP